MHALVTGASGFLGAALVRLLQAEGASVTLLARPSSRLAPSLGIGVVREQLDSTDAASPELISLLRSTTHIFHCAGCSTDWAAFSEYHQANVVVTARLLQLAQEHASRLVRFVHVSTTDVYGYPERAGDETLPLVTTAMPYNRTKLLGDQLAQRAYSADGLPVTIVRPSSIYGRGGKAFVTDIIALLRQRLMLLVDGGRVPGGFVHVEDVCRAMVLAATMPDTAGKAYNVSSIDGTTWLDYTSSLAATLRLPRPWLRLPFGAALGLARLSEIPQQLGVPGRPLLTRHAVHLLGRDQQYSIVRAQQELGWSPSVALADGIERSLEPAANTAA